MKQLLMNRNEVFQRPSPKVLNTLKNFKAEHVNRYFDEIDGYYNSILIPKISKIFGISDKQVIISYGEEDFFRTVFERLSLQKDFILTSQLHYSYLDKYLYFKGINLLTFRMYEKDKNFVFDVEDCIKQYQKFNPKVILIASPNNPTGNSLSVTELEKILKNTRVETLVIFDEAYYGFDEGYNQQAFLSLLNKYANLVLLRSFSKRYALSGFRIGFALCGVNIKNLLNYQNRYLGLSRILEEVAIAALESEDYYKKISSEIIGDREYFIKSVRNFNNFKPFNSKANFVFMRVASGDIIKQMQDAFTKEEVIIGKFMDDNLLRVTIGYNEYTRKFLKLLERIDNLN